MAHDDDKRSTYPSTHEDHEGKGYSEIAEDSTKPVITTARVIVHEAPEPKKRELMPDIKLETEVIWGPLPPEPKPKPERVATIPKTHIMEKRAAQKRVPSIGSMQPDRGKR